MTTVDPKSASCLLVTPNLQHQFISGENYCKDAYRIAEEIGYLEELKNSCDCLTRSYDGQGDVNLAFKYYKEYHVYIDSI